MQRTLVQRLLLVLGAAIGIAGLLPGPAVAAEMPGEVQGHRFWGELGLGYGYVERKATAATLQDNSLALDLSGGFRISPSFNVGLDLGGFNLQATCLSTPTHICTPSELNEGRGIEHLFIVADYRPSGRDGWLLHGGLGVSGYWAQSFNASYGRDTSYGWGGELGTGYTWHFGNATHLGARAGYEFGHLSGNSGSGVPSFDYSALKLTVIFAYY